MDERTGAGQHHVAEAAPGAYDEIIERLGRLHEESHLASLGAYEDISEVELQQLAARTLEAILATETNDENERNARMDEILKYNCEDLGAKWAVFDWLRKK
jgi:predicted RecB family nuclease